MSTFLTAPKFRKYQALDDNAIANLPEIICGPLLRKIYYDNVSVWLAFKNEVTDIKLDIFQANDPSKIILSGTATRTLKLGKNLHVILVTAVSTGAKLIPGIIYGYNTSFKLNGALQDLKTDKVIKGGISSICYPPFSSPTFCLPADNINNLKIVHGSCRKAHGGRTDALRGIDTMLEIYGADPAARPQLLCLTGDQIYADDVADALLYKIIDSKKSLLGWTDTIPKTRTHPNGIDPKELRAGYRKNLIARTGNKSTGFKSLLPTVGITGAVTYDDLTTTDAKSHLIFLSEFLLMYLFTFSDSFLATYDWPSFDMVYNTAMSPEQRKTRLDEYNKELKELNSFTRSLPYVKKALANISSLMIFDDHDITDDWFLSKEWSQVALAEQTLSRRYILNGLTSYAIFQDWGNDHTRYLPGTKGYEVLKTISNQQLPSAEKIKIISPILLPTLSRNTANDGWELRSMFSWNYVIKYNRVDLCVLNTRTARTYYDGERSLSALTKLFSGPGMSFNTAKLLILVSAAPVFGNIKMEEGQEILRDSSPLELGGIASRWADVTGLYEKDQEAWSFSHKGFEKLLTFLSMFQKVLILSGDVHYSFTSYIRLWNQLGKQHRLTEIVQSTSSAIKNSGSNNHITVIDKKALVHVVVDTSKPYKLIKVTHQKFDKFAPLRANDTPRYRPIDYYIAGFHDLAIPPEFGVSNFQYSMQYMKSANFDWNSPLFKRIRATSQNRTFTDPTTERTFHHSVVVKDSISVLSFTPNSITSSIWYANGKFNDIDDKESNRLLFPYTQHRISFNNRFNEAELPLNELVKRTRLSNVKMELESSW